MKNHLQNWFPKGPLRDCRPSRSAATLPQMRLVKLSFAEADFVVRISRHATDESANARAASFWQVITRLFVHFHREGS